LSRHDRVGDPVPHGFVHHSFVPHKTNAVHIHEHEAGGVPDFVGEGAVALGAAFAEGDVGAGSGHGREGESRRVGAEALDDLEGINHVAFGLRHLLAIGIADESVDINLAKRDAVVLFPFPATCFLDSGILFVSLHEVATEHDHARDPEEKNFVGGDEQRGRIKRRIGRAFFPASLAW